MSFVTFAPNYETDSFKNCNDRSWGSIYIYHYDSNKKNINRSMNFSVYLQEINLKFIYFVACR